jgi:hypothetical protein
MATRTLITVSSNGVNIPVATREAEMASFEPTTESRLASNGAMVARPDGHHSTLRRTMNRRDAKLTLLQVAIASQRFNLLARSPDQHPTAVVEEQRQHGTEFITDVTTHLRDFQPTVYELECDGDGAAHLSGCTVHESLKIVASTGTITLTADPVPVPFNFKD